MTSKLIERLINKEYLTERERKEWLGHIKDHLEVLENACFEQGEAYANILEANEKYYEANEKLKKAIEILKGKLELCESIYSQLFNSNEYYLLCNKTLTKQEYELLKEVLGNEMV